MRIEDNSCNIVLYSVQNSAQLKENSLDKMTWQLYIYRTEGLVYLEFLY